MEMNIRQQWSRSGVFGLPYLYKKFIGGNQQHRAQADCEALLKVCLVFGEEFLQYINNNKNRVTWKDLNRLVLSIIIRKSNFQHKKPLRKRQIFMKK